jgi:predicted nucleic acid-binding protein
MYIIDSNVFAKLFIEEADFVQAISFFEHCIQQEISLLAPSLLRYEILQIALFYRHPLADALERLEQYCAFNLTLCELSGAAWQIAEAICQHGHPKSGFPSLYDSCYHALAIEQNATFITADKRHKTKAEKFGHLVLLDEFRI